MPSPKPNELILLSYIDRFGVEAVTGKNILPFGDARRMIVAENIVEAYRDRKKSGNWAEWAEKNPSAAELLRQVEMTLSEDN
jgi:hypothetical protein